jgi:hypothetical protein
MAITISVIETLKQVIANIPEYISVSIGGVSNAIVFYTFDGSVPDTTGNSPSTKIMEHLPGDPLHGTIFLPSTANFLDLNIFAVGTVPNDTINFYRRYGLEPRNIGIGRPGIDKPVQGGSGYTNTISPNIAPDGSIIANDGITEGSTVIFDITKTGFDGYVDGYAVATSGVQTTIPSAVYDHIEGYVNNNDQGFVDGYSTTTLTFAQELSLKKLSDRGAIFVDDGRGKTYQPDLRNIDPRSSAVMDSDGRQINVIPIQDAPTGGKDGYTVDVGANSIDDNIDNAAPQQAAVFTSGGMFDLRAAYIEIDSRVDGYINGQPILPGDRVIINKPYGSLRYLEKREDLGEAIRKTQGIITGGLSSVIYDYQKGQAAFYYWDAHDNRWLTSLVKFEPPKYELIARRNGVVLGSVFKWIINRRQVLPA